MLARLYLRSRFGFILSALNLFLSVLWIAIAYDNPWHQGLLMMMDFPASYLAIGFAFGLIAVLPNHDLFVNVASDGAYLVVGAAWFYFVGLVTQKLYGALSKKKKA